MSVFFYFTLEYSNPFNLPIIADLALFFNYLKNIKIALSSDSILYFCQICLKIDNDTAKEKIAKIKIKIRFKKAPAK